MLAILSPGSQAPLLALWELLVAFKSLLGASACVSSSEAGHLLGELADSRLCWTKFLVSFLPSAQYKRGQHLGFE